jgi:dipeptidyl aminopeptidase/acylaminoacyl peptidase
MLYVQHIRLAAFALCGTVLAGLLAGCAPSVQYSVTTDVRESATTITRITTDADSVAGCSVYWKGKSWLYDARNRIAVAGNGTALAYMTQCKQHSGVIVRALDSTLRLLKTLPEGALDPCFSPNSMRLAFVRGVHASWNIYETGINSVPAVKRITNETGINVHPGYASDSSVLFNHIELTPGDGLPVVDAQVWGTAPSGIMQYAAGTAPTAIPHSTAVVVVRYNAQQRTTQLWRIDLATGSEQMLFGKPGWGVQDPSVSPSGDMIAFVAMTEQKKLRTNLDIYTINSDGTGLVQRTFFTGNDICPRWDGSGKALYFVSQRGTKKGTWNIWKLQLAAQTVPVDTVAAPAPIAKDTLTLTVAAPDTQILKHNDTIAAPPAEIDMSSIAVESEISVTDSAGTIVTGKVVFVGKKGIMLKVNGENISILREDIRKVVPAIATPAPAGTEGSKQ